MNPASSALAHFLVAVVFLARAAAASTCEDLTALAIKNVTITSARLFAAGTVRPASGAPREVPASCRVAATLKPTSDSDIKMEIWMPVERWNSKFQANGNGGWSGFINPAALA